MKLRLFAVLFAAATLAPAQYFTLTKEKIIELTKTNPYDRFESGRPKVPDAVLEKVHGLTVEEVWGFLNSKQYTNQYEDGWRILHPGKKLVGRAVTAQFMPARPDLNELVIGDLKRRNYASAAHQWVIDQLQPGDVLVADIFGKKEGGSIVGDNLATAIKSATVNGGLVVNGAIRDLEGIQPVNMGQSTVVPGDVVFGDRTGIYFIPPQFVQPIIDRAEETHIHDEWTKEKFLSGRYVSSDLYPRPKDPKLQKEYEEYKKKRLGK
jgi:4-hydroxy-4-methyl-2-oxoglutarate aldolase